jgi:hypothetical protein
MKTVSDPDVRGSHLDGNDVPDALVDEIDLQTAKRAYAAQLNARHERADAYVRFMVNGDHKRKSDPKHFVSTLKEWAKVFADFNDKRNPLTDEEQRWLRSKQTTPMPETLAFIRARWQKAIGKTV